MILKSKIIPVIGKYLFDRELCFHKDILNDKVAEEKKKTFPASNAGLFTFLRAKPLLLADVSNT